jgi:DNA repair exonuclease SbcCD ATPase subunit
MDIRISKLELTNFKCFREKSFGFGSDIVTIQGRNGVGKTTIFDAILFCLFGKNSQDQTKFDIKTHDEQGNIIPHLDHSVEMELHIYPSNGSDVRVISLRHSVKEKWTKKRGATEEIFAGDTHEYYVNGELYTAGDYKKYIASLIDEQTFRILTNPQYFTSLKWQDQRDILTRMVGSIEPEVIANTDELAALVRQLDDSNDDIISYKKHLGYQIKKIKEQLEKIPVRLEEQNKALPEKLDWAGIKTILNNKQTFLKGVESDILTIKQGNGSDVKRKELTNQISETTAAIDKLRYEAESKARDLASEKAKKVNEQSLKFSEALNNQRLMEQTIEGDKRLISRCEETIMECGTELEQLRIAWPTRKFEFDPQIEICPTCGQPLPPDLLYEMETQMEENFKRALESEKQSLRDKAAKVKENMASAEKELKSLNEKLASDTEALTKMKEEINVIHSEKARLEKMHTWSVEELLLENDTYVKLATQLERLNTELISLTDSEDNREKLTELEGVKALCEAEIANLQCQLATKTLYDKIFSLIDGINAEQKDLVQQLSELELKEDIARQYEDRQNEILESRVNEHFKITRWKMFRTVVNNGDPYNEPYCECYDLNGTAYHDGLNQAARLNIGLDVINAMSNVYNTSAPVIIDQSESTLNILPTSGQQLRLQVVDTDLQIV